MTRGVESLPAPNERRRLREAAHLTPEQVASAVGVTVNTVRSWEAGRTRPRGRMREAYAAFLAGLASPPAGPEPQSEAPSGADAASAEAAVSVPETTGTAEPESTAPPQPEAAAEPEPAAEPAEHPAPAAAAAATPTPTPAPAPAPAPAGATAGFDALYAHAAPALARQTYLLTGRRALALEAVEQAFHRAWNQWPEVATDPDPEGWVRAVAYEYALSPWHRYRHAHRQPDPPPAEPSDRILLDAVLALPAIHRRTVLLYDGVGLDLPDTAAETEATTPATGSRLLHAHADLAERIPELAAVPPQEQSAVLHGLFAALQPAAPLDLRPAAAVRGGSERRIRLWSRATLGLTAVIAAATAYTAVTAPTHYEPPRSPGESVSGVPPLSGPQQLTEQSRQLHDKLRADPAAGPARIAPKVE
ncbi:helix-turn-helix domain-containing protein [Streptomyces sp. NPDC005409]|uniref:helix-turn-helix domain-containing protein n=1 Tax=Streptomyces sp. NPDC005409 TaxID=3155342 RepID=UPI0034525898